jgi:hypothetical protein
VFIGMAKITMVKKIFSDGNECNKCREVTDFLTQKKLIDKIDRIVCADVRDPESEGMKLVRQWNMKRAPFFIVEDSGRTAVYTSVMDLVRKEL